MFLGTYIHRLDGKGRLTLPSKFRSFLGTDLVVTKGMDTCLFLFPMERWRPLAQQLDGLPLGKREARMARRWLLGNAHLVTPDRLGRILLPAPLREYAGIEQEVMVVGLETYIELWAPEMWQQEIQGAEERGLAEEQWDLLGI